MLRVKVLPYIREKDKPINKGITLNRVYLCSQAEVSYLAI